MSDYKYLKYKNKYNNLKNSLKNNTYNMVGGKFKEDLERLRSNDSSLTKLDLHNQYINYVFAPLIAPALISNTHLTHLILSSNDISDIGAQTITNALIKNTTLKYLNFSNNRITNIGAEAIAFALTYNNTLIDLELRQNWIGPIGATAIAVALTHNTALKHLDFSRNSISDIGAESISYALAHNTTLTDIDLRDNHISDVGHTMIADAVENNYTLLSVLCSTTNEIDTRIFEYCEENRHIKEKFEKIFIKTRQIMKSMGIRDMSRLPPELWRQIILENFELSPREQNYYYFLENQPCPCRNRHCTGDAIEPCFIQNLYMKERSSSIVPAASENVD